MTDDEAAASSGIPGRVLLTGASGYLGGHVALALLAAGYTVRGSVRSSAAASRVRKALGAAGADLSRLELVQLDLLSDQGWREAMAGCRYLQHTASPFVIDLPADRGELVRPAVEGTRRALEAALASGVERVVLTSSMAAVAYGHDRARGAPFTASDWTRLAVAGPSGADEAAGAGQQAGVAARHAGSPAARPRVNAYIESKTRAEHAAWAIMRAAGRESDLVAINPGLILGPLLDADPGTSALVVSRLLDGTVPAMPRLPLTLVDVRDVAQAHVLAMTAPQVGGRRLLMGERAMLLPDVAAVLREAFPGWRVPRRVLPDWLLRAAAPFSRNARAVVGELGVRKPLDSHEAVALLGRDLIPARLAILETARSLMARGLVRHKGGRPPAR